MKFIYQVIGFQGSAYRGQERRLIYDVDRPKGPEAQVSSDESAKTDPSLPTRPDSPDTGAAKDVREDKATTDVKNTERRRDVRVDGQPLPIPKRDAENIRDAYAEVSERKNPPETGSEGAKKKERREKKAQAPKVRVQRGRKTIRRNLSQYIREKTAEDLGRNKEQVLQRFLKSNWNPEFRRRVEERVQQDSDGRGNVSEADVYQASRTVYREVVMTRGRPSAGPTKEEEQGPSGQRPLEGAGPRAPEDSREQKRGGVGERPQRQNRRPKERDVNTKPKKRGKDSVDTGPKEGDGKGPKKAGETVKEGEPKTMREKLDRQVKKAQEEFDKNPNLSTGLKMLIANLIMLFHAFQGTLDDPLEGSDKSKTKDSEKSALHEELNKMGGRGLDKMIELKSKTDKEIADNKKKMVNLDTTIGQASTKLAKAEENKDNLVTKVKELEDKGITGKELEEAKTKLQEAEKTLKDLKTQHDNLEKKRKDIIPFKYKRIIFTRTKLRVYIEDQNKILQAKSEKLGEMIAALKKDIFKAMDSVSKAAHMIEVAIPGGPEYGKYRIDESGNLVFGEPKGPFHELFGKKPGETMTADAALKYLESDKAQERINEITKKAEGGHEYKMTKFADE